MRWALVLCVGCTGATQPAVSPPTVTPPTATTTAPVAADAGVASPHAMSACDLVVVDVNTIDAAFNDRLAAMALDVEMPRLLPTGTASKPAVVASKQTGDYVKYELDGRSLEGVFVSGELSKWVLGRRDNRVFVVVPKSIRLIVCRDPSAAASTCDKPAGGYVVEVPAGTRYSGMLVVDAAWARLHLVGETGATCTGS